MKAKQPLVLNTGRITSVILDLDGVLTDGKQYIDKDGRKRFKAVNARDKMAIRRLLAKGYNVIILTMDDWPGAKEWFEDIGCIFIASKNKENEDLRFGTAIGCGDDIADHNWLKKCKFAYAPADADFRLKFERLAAKGGEGIVPELERILDNLYNQSEHDLHYRTDIA